MFSPISLTQLNATASFLDRIDTKYVVTEQKFIDMIADFKDDFFVLEIGGKSVFEYDSVYMDSEDYDFYITHQKGAESRSKVRTRKYIESDIVFFEYKQKKDRLLRKFRYQMKLEDHGKMTPDAEKFFEEIHNKFYPLDPVKKLTPSLVTHCNRLTLCSKDSSERVTIDFNVTTTNLRGNNNSKVFQNAVIIESKATTEECLSSKILKKHNTEASSGCSKYCLGLLYTGVFQNPGKFKDTMEQINAMS